MWGLNVLNVLKRVRACGGIAKEHRGAKNAKKLVVSGELLVVEP